MKRFAVPLINSLDWIQRSICYPNHNRYKDVHRMPQAFDLIEIKVKIIEYVLMKSTNFFIMLWRWNTYPKQWIWWSSSWQVELIIKKTVILIINYNSFFAKLKNVIFNFSLGRTAFLSSCKDIILIFF